MYNYIRMMRPRQWTKNSLVFAAIIFSRHYTDASDWISTVIVFAGFCLTASAIYIINDIFDAELDRLHPDKLNRPVAAGKVKVIHALIFAIILLAGGLTIGLIINKYVFIILSGYAALMIFYSLGLKHLLLLDVFIIGFGMISRAAIGAVAIDVSFSNWLLVCTFFISLMLALTKRRQELARVGENPEKLRRSLRNAPPLQVWDRWIMMMAGITILAYTLYTMDAATVQKIGSQRLLLTMPFVVFAIFRYQIAAYSDNFGEDPTETLLADKWILAAIAGWLIVVFLVISKVI